MKAFKLLRDVEKSFDDASFKAKIAEVTSSLADVKFALVDARTEAAEKDAEIARLRKEFALKIENTVMSRGFRFEKTIEGGPQGMPFCTRCETVDARLIQIVGTSTKDGYKSVCPQCKADFGRQRGYGYADDRPADTQK